MTIGWRISEYRTRIRSELESAFNEHHSPREVAGSFSLGVFITALPTLGTGLILFVFLVLLFERISKIALFASVLVLNPVVKWGVYISSFWLGTLILGPIPNGSIQTLSYSAGPAVVSRLLVGNMLLAIIFAVVGYVIVFRLVVEYRNRDIDVVDILPEPIVERTPLDDG